MKYLMASMRISPRKYALICASIYFLIAIFYIQFSTTIASSMASSLLELERIERVKGFAFVAVTSVLFFLFSLTVFNYIASSATSLVRSQQRLAMSERDATAGLIASSVAHDFNNLLTIIRLNAERIKNDPGLSQTSLNSLDKINEGMNRLGDLADRMKSIGQNSLIEAPQNYDLRRTLEETVGYLKIHNSVRNCQIEISGDPVVQTVGYPILVQQLLMNLILNAAEATDGHGLIRVEASNHPNWVCLRVHDNGPGVSPLLRENVFEAFFTTKKFGSGLGLASVKSCVEIHGGDIKIETSPLGGALFIVRLPKLPERENSRHKSSEFLNKISSPSGITLQG